MKKIWDFVTTANQNPPKIFGLAHIFVIILTIVLIVLVVLFLRKTNERVNKIILISVGGYLLLFEIIKQAVLMYDGGNYFYNLHHLPLQPCSALMYSIFIGGFICNSKNEKVKIIYDFLLCFIAYYGFFSGMSAIVLPSAIFPEPYVFLVVQSMQHHILLALISIYLFMNNRVKIATKEFLKSLVAFGAFCFLAFVLNLIFYAIFRNPAINLMYMGPFKIWEIPLISDLIPINSYALFLPLYFIGYSGAVLLASLIFLGVQKICNSLNKRLIKKP